MKQIKITETVTLHTEAKEGGERQKVKKRPVFSTFVVKEVR